MISIFELYRQLFSISFNNNVIIIFCNGFEIYHAYLDNGLYVLRLYESFTFNIEMFKIAKQQSNKRQIVSNDDEAYLWHLRLGHISLDWITD